MGHDNAYVLNVLNDGPQGVGEGEHMVGDAHNVCMLECEGISVQYTRRCVRQMAVQPEKVIQNRL